MTEAVGFGVSLAALGFVVGQGAAWWLCRRRMRRQSESLRARIEHRIADQEHWSTALHDGLLQDVQGLALSLQAVADRLPADDPARRRLERILDQTDALLTEGQRRAKSHAK